MSLKTYITVSYLLDRKDMKINKCLLVTQTPIFPEGTGRDALKVHFAS